MTREKSKVEKQAWATPPDTASENFWKWVSASNRMWGVQRFPDVTAGPVRDGRMLEVFQ